MLEFNQWGQCRKGISLVYYFEVIYRGIACVMRLKQWEVVCRRTRPLMVSFPAEGVETFHEKEGDDGVRS